MVGVVGRIWERNTHSSVRNWSWTKEGVCARNEERKRGREYVCVCVCVCEGEKMEGRGRKEQTLGEGRIISHRTH